MTTLHGHAHTYVMERRKRGEITRKTAKNYRSHLDGFDRSFGNRPLTQLKPRAVERWLETIGHLAPSTRRNHLIAVRGFCRWLVDRKLIKADPTDKLPRIRQPRSVPRAMTVVDVAKLFASAPDLRGRAVIALMVGCGLRCVEVSRLQVTDWDRDGATITVTGKGMHERVLPVPSETTSVLDRYLSSIGGFVSGPLIRSSRIRGAGLSEATISTYVSRWMGAAGLKVGRWDGRSAHALRHTAASDVLDGCGDLRVVQAMLGHQHLSSTSIYLRRAQLGQMRDAMEGRSYLDEAA
jgi:site-specific recombinase XerD